MKALAEELKEIGIACAIWFIFFLLFTGVVYAVLSILTPFFEIDTAFYSTSVGCIAMIVLICKTWGLLTINVPGQEAWVTANELKPKTAEMKDRLKVYVTGFHFIFPWQKVMPEKTIPLGKPILTITSDWEKTGEHPTYTSQDKVSLTAYWSVVIRADPKNLQAYVTWDVNAIKTTVASIIDQRLSDACAKKHATAVIGDKIGMSEDVAKFFGGEGNSSPTEDKFGIIISNPVLSDIDLGDEDRERFAKLAIVDEIMARARTMVTASEVDGKPTMSLETAMQRVAIAMGQAAETVYKGLAGALPVVGVGGQQQQGGQQQGGKGGGKQK